MKEIQSIAMANSLPGWEVPADILLEPLPFSVENGLLTSTLKTNRPKLEQKYKSSLEEVYSKLNNSSINRFGESSLATWINKHIYSFIK